MNVPMTITINTPVGEYDRKGHMEIGDNTVLQSVLAEFPDCTSVVMTLCFPDRFEASGEAERITKS